MIIINKMAAYTYQYEIARHVLNILAEMDVPLQIKYPVSVLGDITLSDFTKIRLQIAQNPALGEQWKNLSDVIDKMITDANNTASKMLLYDAKIQKFLSENKNN